MSDDTVEVLRERIRDLESVLKLNDHGLLVTFRLPPIPNKIFGLLVALPLVTPDMIQQRLEIVTEAKVAISRLRAYLKPFNIEVHSKRRVGYWLEADTKARIKAMVAAQGNPTPEMPPEVKMVVQIKSDTQREVNNV